MSSFQPIICVSKRTHRVSRRTHRVCRRTQCLWSETVLSKKYSARFLVSFPTQGSEIRRRGHWKGGICINCPKLIFLICDNFAHPSSHVQNEIPAILRGFGARFATNLPNGPLANAPFFKRESHQSFVQPGFRAEGGGYFRHFLLIFLPVFGAKKGREKKRSTLVRA